SYSTPSDSFVANPSLSPSRRFFSLRSLPRRAPSSPWSSRRLGLGFRSISPNPSEERLCPPSPAMEGSAGDPGAPDSWEMADLDASMSRMLLSSKKGSALSPSQEAEEEEEAAASAAALDTTRASLASVERAEGVPMDAVGQVDQFLREALEKPRERLAILRMEQDIVKFICDPTQQQLEFQAIPNSYLRLAAHRIAQHYYLQSVAIQDNSLPDGSGSRILMQKTSFSCRRPPVRLADIPVNLPQEDTNAILKVAIKQRPQKHSQIMSNANTQSYKTNRQKSVEERKEEYNRARARIFNSNDMSSTISYSNDEVKLPDTLQDCSFVSARSDEKTAIEGSEKNLGRSFGDSSSGSSILNRTKLEKEPIASRYKTNNRVAIFRDREVDSKDPDYDRSYDRYMQRFDPGFGFNGGPGTIQPLYSPAVNYNTEFPQLGSGHGAQFPVDHQPQPIPQHLHGPWLSPSAPNVINYGPPAGMMPTYNSNHVHAHSTTSVYMNSSQYSVPPHPGMSFAHPNGHIQSFAQQLPDTSFGLARPR
ncbi:unnamed protein product, partial [Musa textilis]